MKAETDTPNVQLLITTLEQIKRHPEDHDQENWRCGTSSCFAGHAAILAGAQWATGPDAHSAQLPPGAIRLDPDDDTDMQAQHVYSDDVTWIAPDGTRMYQHVSAYARRVLGFSLIDTGYLFMASNSIEDLENIVARLTSSAEQPSM